MMTMALVHDVHYERIVPPKPTSQSLYIISMSESSTTRSTLRSSSLKFIAIEFTSIYFVRMSHALV